MNDIQGWACSMKPIGYFILLSVISSNAFSDIFNAYDQYQGELSTTKKSSWHKKIDFVTSLGYEKKQLERTTIESLFFEDDNYLYTDDLDAEDESLELSVTIGGRIVKANALYLTLAYEKIRLKRELVSSLEAPDGDSLFYQDSEENGGKLEINLLATHKINHIIELGFEVYYEDYDTGYDAIVYDDDSIFFTVSEDYQGDASGGRIYSGIEVLLDKTHISAIYSHKYDEFNGLYFAVDAFSKRISQIELLIDHQWQYGLTTEFSIIQFYDHSFTEPETVTYFMGPEKIQSQLVTLNLKKLLTDNTLIKFSYDRFNFGVDALSISLDYQLGNEKPKRRKRRNRLMRNPAL